MDTIFIQIASYRDPELTKTIASCIRNCSSPERLRFGIVNQYAAEDTFNADLDQYRIDDRFRIIDVVWHESKGACWARALQQTLYRGETYTMQLDSHMRFARANTRHRLEELGVTKDEVLESLRRLPSFTVEQKHWYSHARMIDPGKINNEEVIGLLNW